MKLTKISQQQKESLKEKKEYFVKKFLNSEKINKEIAIEVITFVYSLIKKSCPKIYKVISPMAAQKLANKLNGTDKKYYSFGSYLTMYWASFYSFYETFVDFGIITEEKFPKYFKLRKFIDSNIFLTIEFEKAIIICEKPIFIKKNDSGMHSIDGPAIKWDDGYSQHYINGRAIPRKYFYAIKEKSFTINDFFNESNEEIKSVCIQAMMEMHGDNYVSSFFGSILKEVDTYVDEKRKKYLEGTTQGMNIGVYTLFNGDLNGYKISYVRCYCPSTDRMFYLGVEPKFSNAKDAIASLYVIPSKLKNHIKSIRRQGERFSTSFTDKGRELIKDMSKDDFENLTSISGSEYFEKMEYEF